MSKSETSKLNIENLFCANKNKVKPKTNGKLDIHTLFKLPDTEKDFEFNSDCLLDGIKKKKEKLNNTYFNIYKICCNTIISANNSETTDIEFKVPYYVPECIDYDTLGCLCYIQDKLQEQEISTYLISRTKMFITWNNLEEKLKEKI